MPWDNRVRSQITFISPERNLFTGKWRSGQLSIEKKLGIFDYPKIKGTGVQDLEVTSTNYPITFFFDGPNHDLEAKAFTAAAKESGVWRINHPIKGPLTLQLVSLQETFDHVGNANLTEFQTSWIEPIGENFFETISELRGLILIQKAQAKAAAVSGFLRNVKNSSGRVIQAVEDAEASFSTIIDGTVGNLVGTAANLAGAYDSIKRGIADILAESPPDFEQFASAFYELVAVGVGGGGTPIEKAQTYSDLQAEALDVDSRTEGVDGIASLGTKELLLSAIVSAQADIVSRENVESKAQAVELVNLLKTDFVNMTDTLDDLADNYSGETMDLAYFSQSRTFPVLAVLSAQSQRFLIRSLFDLSVEKRFTIDRPRAPIEIAVSEYGNIGENGANLDYFIQTNRLHGAEIMLLNRGREVVVYV